MWRIIALLFILTSVATVVIKKCLTDRIKIKANGVWYTFFFCLLFSCLFAFAAGNVNFDLFFLALLGVGISNAASNIFLWKALEFSMAKTSIFLPLIDILAISLAFFVLDEGSYVTLTQVIGAVFCFLGLGIFFVRKTKGGARDSMSLVRRSSFIWLLSLIVVLATQGINTFLLKIFAVHEVSPGTFMLGWYGGSFLGASIIVLVLKSKPQDVPWRHALSTIALSGVLVGGMIFFYLLIGMGKPLTLVLPLRQAAQAFLPIPIGWWLFHERKSLSWPEGVGYAFGLAGSLLLII